MFEKILLLLAVQYGAITLFLLFPIVFLAFVSMPMGEDEVENYWKYFTKKPTSIFYWPLAWIPFFGLGFTLGVTLKNINKLTFSTNKKEK